MGAPSEGKWDVEELMQRETEILADPTLLTLSFGDWEAEVWPVP